jgi:cell division protein FtsB
MWDKWVKLTLALVVGCAIGVGLMVLYRPGANELKDLDGQIARIEANNARLDQEKRDLDRRKLMLENDPLTIEIEARNRLRFTKEGETVYVVEGWPDN